MKNLLGTILNSYEKSLKTYIGKAGFVFTFSFLGCCAAIWVMTQLMSPKTVESPSLEPTITAGQGLGGLLEWAGEEANVSISASACAPSGKDITFDEFRISVSSTRTIFLNGEAIGYESENIDGLYSIDDVLGTERDNYQVLAQSDGVAVFCSEVAEVDRVCGGSSTIDVYCRNGNNNSISRSTLFYEQGKNFSITYGALNLSFKGRDLIIKREGGSITYQGKLPM